MEHIAYFLLFGLGLVMIIKGSDWFINAVIYISTVFKIPYLIIGVTIVSICTSLPETFVSATAALKGETDVAFGNALGSIAVNTGLIMGIIMVFSRAVISDRKNFKKNGLVLISLLLITFMIGLLFGEISRVFGFILLGLFVLYIVYNVCEVNKKRKESAEKGEKENAVETSGKTIARNIMLFLAGITLVIMGSDLLVDNGILIAELLNIPTILIAVTFTSFGTSLPELVTTIASIRKGVTNLGVGNIIGANIMNIIQVLSVSSIIKNIPLSHDTSILFFQLPFVLIIVTSAILFGVAYREGFKRWNGFVLFGLYAFFLVVNLLRENTPILGPIIFRM